MIIIRILGLGTMMEVLSMYKYEEHLAYPVNIKKKDLKQLYSVLNLFYMYG